MLCCLKDQSREPAAAASKGTLLYQAVSRGLSPCVLSRWLRPLLMLLLLGWVCFCLAAVSTRLEVGLDQRLSMPLDSYVLDYFDSIYRDLAVGPPVYFVVTSGHNYTSWDAGQRAVCSFPGCAATSLPNVVAAYAKSSNLSAPPPSPRLISSLFLFLLIYSHLVPLQFAHCRPGDAVDQPIQSLARGHRPLSALLSCLASGSQCLLRRERLHLRLRALSPTQHHRSPRGRGVQSIYPRLPPTKPLAHLSCWVPKKQQHQIWILFDSPFFKCLLEGKRPTRVRWNSWPRGMSWERQTS